MEWPVRWMKYSPKPCARDETARGVVHFESAQIAPRAHRILHASHRAVASLAHDRRTRSHHLRAGCVPQNPVQVMS